MSDRARNLLSIAALIGALLFGYGIGYAVGYEAGRCETFDAFVVAAGFPLEMRGSYKPPECR
jgi:hypothetical protein